MLGRITYIIISHLCWTIAALAVTTFEIQLNVFEQVDQHLANDDLVQAREQLLQVMRSINHQNKDTLWLGEIEQRLERLGREETADSFQMELHMEWAGRLRAIYQEFDLALQQIGRAEVICRSLGSDAERRLSNVLNMKVLILGAQHNWQDAKQVLLTLVEQAEAQKYFDRLPTLYHNLGFIKERLLEDGTPDLERGLAFMMQYDSTSLEGHNLFNSLGRLYYRQRNFEQSSEIFRLYYEWVEKNKYKSVPRAIVGRLRTAIEMGDTTLAMQIEAQFLSQITSYNLVHQQEFYFSISDGYIHDDPAKSVYYAQMGLGLPIDIYRDGLTFMLGFGYFALSKFEQALEHMQAYFRSAIPSFLDADFHTNPKVATVTNYRMATAFTIKGRALYQLGRKRNNQAYLQVAYRSILAADSILQKYRGDLAPGERQTWNEYLHGVASTGVRMAHFMHQQGYDGDWMEEIFRWSEKSKSQSQLDKTTRESLWMQLDLPNDLIETENDYLAKIELLNDQLIKHHSSDSVDHWRGQLVKFQRQFDHFKQNLRKNYPQYYALRHQPQTVTIQQIQSLIAADEAMLTYFTTDSIIYGFLIQSDTFFYQSIGPLFSVINHDIPSLYQCLSERSPNMYSESNRIYNQVVDPLLRYSDAVKIIVISDKNLAKIPFDLLVSDFGTSRFLIQDYIICHYPSASLYFAESARHRVGQGMLALAPSFDASTSDGSTAQRAQLVELPGAREEIDMLQSNWQGIFRSGPSASEGFFKANAAEFNILHIASHALVNQEEEGKDGILLAADHENDGLLERLELYHLSIPAQLTTLSACNSGVGDKERQGDIYSLAHAFHYAGCRNILMSMWAVQDATTGVVMKSFYDYLLEGETLPEANRQAKLDFLKSSNPKFRHPYYWGSFVMMGHHEMLDVADNGLNYLTWFHWLLIIVFLVGISLLIRSRNKVSA